MDEACKNEIIALHLFFEAWFKGALPNTSQGMKRFTSVMGPDFQRIDPWGGLTERNPLAAQIEAAHGCFCQTPFRIWIEDVHVRSPSPSLFVATYEEWQENAGEISARLSSVVFRKKQGLPNGLEWVHVHEVWLPQSCHPK